MLATCKKYGFNLTFLFPKEPFYCLLHPGSTWWKDPCGHSKYPRRQVWNKVQITLKRTRSDWNTCLIAIHVHCIIIWEKMTVQNTTFNDKVGKEDSLSPLNFSPGNFWPTIYWLAYCAIWRRNEDFRHVKKSFYKNLVFKLSYCMVVLPTLFW